MKIAHVTTVHKRYDTRIFLKMCRGAQRSGFEVNLVVADGFGDEISHGVFIKDLGRPSNRLSRALLKPLKIALHLAKNRCAIIHLHDPELLPVGVLLKVLFGRVVIFDAHEDIPLQVRTKPYLKDWQRLLLERCILPAYPLMLRHVTAVICATGCIQKKLRQYNGTCIAIHNYPLLDEFESVNLEKVSKGTVCYVGGLERHRGVVEMIRAIGNNKYVSRLELCGPVPEGKGIGEYQALAGWGKVRYHGFVDREKMKVVFNNSDLGLVLLHPTPNYLDALPVKLFEYMAAGLPVIASNFPSLISIIDEVGCGLTVDPFEAAEVESAITYLMQQPLLRRRMGEAGRAAVQRRYNWHHEQERLHDFYLTLLVYADASEN